MALIDRKDQIDQTAKKDFSTLNPPEKLAEYHGETLLKFTSNHKNDVLEFLCTENGIFRTPTQSEIDLANKFVTFEQFYALKMLGKEHAETTLKITSYNAADALKILCTENGVFRTPTQSEIDLANKFDNYKKLCLLYKFNKENVILHHKIIKAAGANVINALNKEKYPCENIKTDDKPEDLYSIIAKLSPDSADETYNLDLVHLGNFFNLVD